MGEEKISSLSWSWGSRFLTCISFHDVSDAQEVGGIGTLYFSNLVIKGIGTERKRKNNLGFDLVASRESRLWLFLKELWSWWKDSRIAWEIRSAKMLNQLLMRGGCYCCCWGSILFRLRINISVHHLQCKCLANFAQFSVHLRLSFIEVILWKSSTCTYHANGEA